MSEYVVIAGLSGGGRTEASRTFEDLGWFIIDNLPASLISKVADLAGAPGSSIDKVALAVAPGRNDDEQLLPAIAALRASTDRVRVLFLDASTERLVQRYESARRRHPFMADAGIEDAVEAERSALEAVKGEADIVVDTTEINVHELRARINELFGGEDQHGKLRTRVLSFGFKHGLPRDVDMVFDCRFLPNPHWVEELRPKSGLDDEVADYVLAQPVARPFLNGLERMFTLLVPAYIREGKSFLSVAFGCTGGHHRSVVMAEHAAVLLKRLGLEPAVEHRDIDR